MLTFGNTTMTFYLVPGHTDGCIAIFFDAHDGDKTVRCGYYGGFGFNTLTVQHLDEYGDTARTMWQTYEDSIRKVLPRKVDIFLGNHTVNNRTLEKQSMLKENPSVNPFIDPSEWETYLSAKIEELHAFIREQTACETHPEKFH